jgi:geranylgeranyl pyrophosphate synthase
MREHVERVHQIIDDTLPLCAAARFRESLRAAFRDRGASEGKGIPWFMLPIFTCEALGGAVEPAHYVAAGMEIGRIAAGCLDEWQDHDTEGALWQAIGPEKTVSLATGMIALSLLALAPLADLGVEPSMVLDLQREFQVTLLHMSEGQYVDLDGDLSLDDYQTVAGAKSGALFRLGCRAGAMVAGAPPDIVGCYGDFGYNLGILVQVWNDIGGLTGVLGKSDTEHRRALPILAASAVYQVPEGRYYQRESIEGQTGELYTLLQISLAHQRTSEALARCPAPGNLLRFLDEYDPGRLIETVGQSRPQCEEDHEQQAVL